MNFIWFAGVALCLSWSPASALPHPRPDESVVVVSTPTPMIEDAAGLPPPGIPVLAVADVPSPPPPPEPTQPEEKLPRPEVRSLYVNSTILYRFAHTLVTSRIANPANRSQEVTFSVTLPDNAFISSFLIEVDGKAYKAYVKPKEEAKATYDQAVAAGQSAGIVAVSARDAKSFTVSLNVESKNKVSFNLTYEELLTRTLDSYHQSINVNLGQVVPDMEIRVHIKENSPLTKLNTPGFSSENEIDNYLDESMKKELLKCSSEDPSISIKCISTTEAEVVFRPTAEKQKEIVAEFVKKKKQEAKTEGYHHWDDPFAPVQNAEDGLNGHFVVNYDVIHSANGGEILVNDGYFVHFFAPPELPTLPKHAIFVLDLSGSMIGRKVEQLKEAMNSILNDLKPHDFFNIIEFSSEVKLWNVDHPEKTIVRGVSYNYYYPGISHGDSPSTTTTTQAPLTDQRAYPATPEYIAKAKEIVNKMIADGGTNIHDALHTALECAKNCIKNEVVPGTNVKPIILFLTDGDPTVGETNPGKITVVIRDFNADSKYQIFGLGFGHDADIKFLRKLSLANFGFARTIYQGSDASIQLKNFYRQIASPLLANVKFTYPPEKVEQESMTRVDFPTYFQGSEIVVAGRLEPKTEGFQVLISGKTENQTVEYKPESAIIDFVLPPIWRNESISRDVSTLERLWVYLKIKQLLDEQDILDVGKDKSNEFGPGVWGDSSTTPPSTTTPKPDKPEPKEKALQLALEYSFVTPLTSLVVVKPNETRATDTEKVVPGKPNFLPVRLAGMPPPPGLPGLQFSPQGYYSSVAMPSSISYSSNANRMASGTPLMLGHSTPYQFKSAHSAVQQISHQISVFDRISHDTLDADIDMSAAPWASPLSSSRPAFGAAGASSFAVNGYSGSFVPNSASAPMMAGFPAAPPPPRPYRKKVPSTPFVVRTTTAPIPSSIWRRGSAGSRGLHPNSRRGKVRGRGRGSPLLGNKIGAFAIAEDTVLAEALDVDRVFSVTTPLYGLDGITWLGDLSGEPTNVTLNLGPNNSSESFQLAWHEADPDPPQACTTTTTTPISGECRHLSNCILPEIKDDIEVFKKYRCEINGTHYLAICCPSSP